MIGRSPLTEPLTGPPPGPKTQVQSHAIEMVDLSAKAGLISVVRKTLLWPALPIDLPQTRSSPLGTIQPRLTESMDGWMDRKGQAAGVIRYLPVFSVIRRLLTQQPSLVYFATMLGALSRPREKSYLLRFDVHSQPQLQAFRLCGLQRAELGTGILAPQIPCVFALGRVFEPHILEALPASFCRNSASIKLSPSPN